MIFRSARKVQKNLPWCDAEAAVGAYIVFFAMCASLGKYCAPKSVPIVAWRDSDMQAAKALLPAMPG
jgi:hypothetical protein